MSELMQNFMGQLTVAPGADLYDLLTLLVKGGQWRVERRGFDVLLTTPDRGEWVAIDHTGHITAGFAEA